MPQNAETLPAPEHDDSMSRVLLPGSNRPQPELAPFRLRGWNGVVFGVKVFRQFLGRLAALVSLLH